MIDNRRGTLFLWVSLVIAATSPAVLFAAEADESGDIQFAPDDQPESVAPVEANGAVPDSASAAPAAPAAAPAASTPPTCGDSAGGGVDCKASSPTPSYVNGLRLRDHSARADIIFGEYRLRLGYVRPTFSDELKHYETLYGRPSGYPEFSADWYGWDWYVTFGVHLGVGYYTDEGHAGRIKAGVTKSKADLTADDIEKDTNGPTTLTLLPFKGCLTATLTPFPAKWLVLDGWAGYERLYFQEVRASASGSSAKAVLATAADESSNDILTNKGWRNSLVVGARLNIPINGLDQTTAASMRGPMGIGSIYLSPYVEHIRTKTEAAGVTFARSVLGLAFTFETVR